MRTSQLPAGGVTAPLIYVGDGKLNNFNGKDVEGSPAPLVLDTKDGRRTIAKSQIMDILEAKPPGK